MFVFSHKHAWLPQGGPQKPSTAHPRLPSRVERCGASLHGANDRLCVRTAREPLDTDQPRRNWPCLHIQKQATCCSGDTEQGSEGAPGWHLPPAAATAPSPWHLNGPKVLNLATSSSLCANEHVLLFLKDLAFETVTYILSSPTQFSLSESGYSVIPPIPIPSTPECELGSPNRT